MSKDSQHSFDLDDLLFSWGFKVRGDSVEHLVHLEERTLTAAARDLVSSGRVSDGPSMKHVLQCYQCRDRLWDLCGVEGKSAESAAPAYAPDPDPADDLWAEPLEELLAFGFTGLEKVKRPDWWGTSLLVIKVTEGAAPEARPTLELLPEAMDEAQEEVSLEEVAPTPSMASRKAGHVVRVRGGSLTGTSLHFHHEGTMPTFSILMPTTESLRIRRKSKGARWDIARLDPISREYVFEQVPLGVWVLVVDRESGT